jgi:P27 family predicted phage terminase small subunit
MPTPRKPDELHKLTGTKSQATPEYAVAPGRPKYPKGISAASRSVFKKLCGLLEKRHALTDGDEELLRLYCIMFDRHARTMAKLAEEGEVRVYTRLDNHGEAVQSERPNLHLKIAETTEKNMVAILDRLGLTPLNRAKVKPTKVEEKPTDPFAALMSRSSRANETPMPSLEELDAMLGDEEEVQ